MQFLALRLPIFLPASKTFDKSYKKRRKDSITKRRLDKTLAPQLSVLIQLILSGKHTIVKIEKTQTRLFITSVVRKSIV